jgi:hypothetical protein
MNYLLLTLPLLEVAPRQKGPGAAAAIAGAWSGSAGGCLGLVYPVLLIVFMTRRKVVVAFRLPATPSA